MRLQPASRGGIVPLAGNVVVVVVVIGPEVAVEVVDVVEVV